MARQFAGDHGGNVEMYVCHTSHPRTPMLKATRCVVLVNRNQRSDSGRLPGRSRRSLARDVNNRATTSRLRHVQHEEMFAVDVDSRGTTTTFVRVNGRKENPTGAQLRQDRDRAADDQHKILWRRTRTMEPQPRAMSGPRTRSHGSDWSVACGTWTRGRGTLRRWQFAWTSMERIWTWSWMLAQWCYWSQNGLKEVRCSFYEFSKPIRFCSNLVGTFFNPFPIRKCTKNWGSPCWFSRWRWSKFPWLHVHFRSGFSY